MEELDETVALLQEMLDKEREETPALKLEERLPQNQTNQNRQGAATSYEPPATSNQRSATSHQPSATSEVKGNSTLVGEAGKLEQKPELKSAARSALKLEEMKAKVVDIPFANLPFADLDSYQPMPKPKAEAGCRQEKSNGRRCGRAVWQNEMCGLHGEWHNTVSAALGLPFPEDQLSFHRFLLKTLDLVVSGKLPAKQLVAVQELCKMIYKNLRTGGFEM